MCEHLEIYALEKVVKGDDYFERACAVKYSLEVGFDKFNGVTVNIDSLK